MCHIKESMYNMDRSVSNLLLHASVIRLNYNSNRMDYTKRSNGMHRATSSIIIFWFIKSHAVEFKKKDHVKVRRSFDEQTAKEVRDVVTTGALY